MNKRKLYESIMKNVAKEVKNALNEGELDEYDDQREEQLYNNFLNSIDDLLDYIKTGNYYNKSSLYLLQSSMVQDVDKRVEKCIREFI